MLATAATLKPFGTLQVGNISKESRYWGYSEAYTAPRPSFWVNSSSAADLTGSMSAAFAAASMAFRKDNPAYSKVRTPGRTHSIIVLHDALQPSRSIERNIDSTASRLFTFLPFLRILNPDADHLLSALPQGLLQVAADTYVTAKSGPGL